MYKSKFDFGDLEPVVEESEIQKKIIAATQSIKLKTEQQQEESTKFIPKTEEEKQIARDLAIIEKGQKCESDVRYALSYLDKTKFRVFMNLKIHGVNEDGEPEDQEHDAIVVCNDMVFDIEAKSISGDILTVCPDGQWEVKAGYKTYAIPNPSAQVLRHKTNIQYRLKNADTKLIELVCTNNDRLLIKDEYRKLPFQIIKTDVLVQQILSLAQNQTELDGRAILLYQKLLSGVKQIYKPK